MTSLLALASRTTIGKGAVSGPGRVCVCCCHHHVTQKNRFQHSDSRCFPPHKTAAYPVPCQPYQINTQRWSYSSIYFKSKYRQTVTCSSNFLLHEDSLARRHYHISSRLWKEDSVVEKSVKVLKGEVEEKKTDKVIQKEKSWFAVKREKWELTLDKMRKTGYLRYFWNAFKNFVLHYKDGFVLFWKNLKYCMPLLLKYLRQGRSSLKRREYKMLTRTLADLFRMVPLIPMVVIPLGEVFIPVYVKMGMMPSVFGKKTTTNEFKRQLQTKVEYAHLLTSSLQDIPLKKGGSSSTIQDFQHFMEKMKNTETIPTIDEIAKFSTLFEDSITLDDLNVRQLQAFCKLLGIGFLGDIPSSRVLRFQIMMKVRELEVDDKVIQKESVDSLTIEELQAANRARGMRALGMSEERLKLQLTQWLELHLKRQVPTSLLLLSRVMYLDENLSPAEQLKQTISALPETTVDKAKVSSAESKGEVVDRKTKIKLLEEEHKAIVKEKEQEDEEKRKAKLAEMEAQEKKKMAELALQKMEEERIARELAMKLEEKYAKDEQVADATEAEKVKQVDTFLEKDLTEDVTPVEDIAQPILETVPEIPEDITAQDLDDIEKAIEDMAIHHKDELSEVKEDLEEYLEDMEDIRALCEEADYEKKINETKGAQTLRTALNKYLRKLDSTISTIQDEKIQLQAKLEQQEVSLKYELDGNKEEILEAIEQKKSNLISVNDILLSLKRLQKVPDDVRMQKVLQVLDTDEDGLIDITDVLKVTEILGSENLKLNKGQVMDMMTLLRKEEEMEQEEKRKEKEGKLKESGGKDNEGKETEKDNGANQNDGNSRTATQS